MSAILLKTIPFIFENKLWIGFFKHKLTLLISIIASLVIPWSIFNFFSSNVKAAYDSNFKNTEIATASLQNAVSFSSLFEGSNKFLIFVLIQMLTVYFSNKTIEHFSGIRIKMSGKELIQSQIRSIWVSGRNWLLNLVIGVGISILLGVFGPKFLEDWLKWAVSCYFMGYLFFDNYNNTFGLTIKESSFVIRKHFGAALAVGIVANILFILPFIGALFVSFICSVAATWYMHTSEDNHVGEVAFKD
ncbi:MAG: hypothetical protein IPO92_23590 [Saprospiraceae bacterium]|nr:hypothetical protein [Saprospiraceae bacterium]